jgi:hypothetical protein
LKKNVSFSNTNETVEPVAEQEDDEYVDQEDI